METIKEYVQIYPLEQFPSMLEFYNNISSFSKEKSEIWEPWIRNTLKNGLQVVCRILFVTEDESKDQVYEAFVSFVTGPEKDWFYLGRSWEKNEIKIIQMLENYTDKVFDIEDCNKEDMQQYLINILLEGDFSD